MGGAPKDEKTGSPPLCIRGSLEFPSKNQRNEKHLDPEKRGTSRNDSQRTSTQVITSSRVEKTPTEKTKGRTRVG